MCKEAFLIHNHSDYSNLRLRDATNRVEDILEYSLELGLPGIALTDHETLSGHVKIERYINDNYDRFKNFKVGYGNEIYLIDKKEEEKREDNERIQYFHFLLLAKNQRGYEFLRKQTTRAWENSYFYKGMQRVPTYYDELKEMIKGYENDVIVSSACIGSNLNQLILAYNNDRNDDLKRQIHENIMYFINLVGKDNFYLELQPAIKHDKSNVENKKEQQIVNDMLLTLAKAYGLTPIITTDAHYLNKEQAKAHEIYLKSSSGEREVAAFYETTYIMDRNELLEYFDEELLDTLIKNTHGIMDKLEPITFNNDTQVPNIDIPKYNNNELFKDYLNEYEYIYKYYYSNREMDRYYLHMLGEGMLSHNQEFNKTNLSRIDIELRQVWKISEKLNQPLSSYFMLTQKVVEMMWEVSLVGVSRGSASCFYTNYLLDIVQINAIDYDLPYWRFLNEDRIELPDIDLDAEASKREDIIQLAKERFGYEKVLNSCTFNTEGSKSTVITAARGLGLSVSEQHNISNLVPNAGASLWSVSDCLFGNEKLDRKPVKSFINRVEQYEGLKETMLTIEGIVSGRSQHASSVIFYPNNFLDVDGMMKTTKGLSVTQYNADDGEYCGNLKLDFLSISALGRIREAMDLLLEDGKIEWQGTLKATYDKYFHPDVLDLESKDMFDLLADGEITDAFQMSSLVARNAMRKIRPETFTEIEITNTIIRLQTDGEQPIDKFVRYKKDIKEWYQDMKQYGLNTVEMGLMEKHLLDRTGICDTQEGIMLIVMDKDIGNSNLAFANKYRKAIAKKNSGLIEECEAEFKKNIIDSGHQEAFADYIIDEQIGLSKHYSFSRPHVSGYTLILMIEMNIAFKYGVEYWQTACLSVNSGMEGDISKGADYTEIAKATNAIKDDMLLPDINKSKMKFTTKDGKTLFSLKAISGLDTNTLDAILEHRPFSSLEDFYTRMVETKLTSAKKTVVLIKAGAFDNLENKDRRIIMMDLVKLAVPPKDKVTITQLPYVTLPNSFNELLTLHNFRNCIEGRNKIPMNEKLEKHFINNYSNEVEYGFENGTLNIDMKSWKKFYNKEIKPLKEELKKPEYAEEFTRQKRKEYWANECLGSVADWEVETLLFNKDKFVLDTDSISKVYPLNTFSNMENEPVLYTNKHGFSTYKTSFIAGVVIGSNNIKRLVYLLTKDDGVVTVKMSRKDFPIYQEKLENDPSWYDKQTKLVVQGYKSGEALMARGNKHNKNSIIKIVEVNGAYRFKSEKG